MIETLRTIRKNANFTIRIQVPETDQQGLSLHLCLCAAEPWRNCRFHDTLRFFSHSYGKSPLINQIIYSYSSIYIYPIYIYIPYIYISHIYIYPIYIYPIKYVHGARLEPWHSWPFWGRDAGLPRTDTYWNLAIRVSPDWRCRKIAHLLFVLGAKHENGHL